MNSGAGSAPGLLAHGDEAPPIIESPDVPTNLLVGEGFEAGDYVGNPLYGVVDEHVLAAIALAVLPLLGLAIAALVRRRAGRGDRWAARLVEGYRIHDLAGRLASWLVAGSAFVHLILAFTHELSIYTLFYLVGAFALAVAAWWLVLGEHPRYVRLALVLSVVAFWFLGAPHDQLGILTKLFEILALGLLVAPREGASRRFRVTGVALLVVATGIAAWIGAFATAGAEGGHHGGEFPEPGTLVPYLDVLEPTSEEIEVAAELYRETVEASVRFEDPRVAAAVGYDIGVIRGTSHHAQNTAYKNDGLILDPTRPESLIYAESPSGPVLVGVMFEMDDIGDRGPRVGGPLTVWHGHENVCLSLFPISASGLLSPLGSCPAGSINLPVTNEMIHVWTLPGVEDQFGHMDEEWLAEYLASR